MRTPLVKINHKYEMCKGVVRHPNKLNRLGSGLPTRTILMPNVTPKLVYLRRLDKALREIMRRLIFAKEDNMLLLSINPHKSPPRGHCAYRRCELHPT